jgi:Mg2+/citrate symporter
VAPTSILPESGLSTPASMRIKVVLPSALAPMIPIISPLLIVPAATLSLNDGNDLVKFP